MGADLPGQSTEWHFSENLAFWLSQSSWMGTENIYAIGVELPRMTYLYFAAIALVIGWSQGPNMVTLSATVAFFGLATLLLFMGFRDEFRNISLATPLLILTVFKPNFKGGIQNPSNQAR